MCTYTSHIRPQSLSAVLFLLLSFLATSCRDGPTEPLRQSLPLFDASSAMSGDPSAASSPITEVPLLADNGALVVGSVSVGNDEGILFVTYTTTDGWTLVKTQVFAGASNTDISLNNGGNPMPGKFPYASRHPDGTTSFTYAIPLSDLGSADPVVVAAHADLVLGDRVEGGWAEGDPISEGGSRGTYFTHDVAECTSELITSAEGGLVTFGGLSLEFPPGAVYEDVQITVHSIDVEDLESPGSTAGTASLSSLEDGPEASAETAVMLGNVLAIPGTAYDLGPEGLQFNPDAEPTLTIAYDEGEVFSAGLSEDQLGLFVLNGVFFAAESTVDPLLNTVSGEIPHFSQAFVGASLEPDLIPASATFSSPATGYLSHSLVVRNVGAASLDIAGLGVMTYFADDAALDSGDQTLCGRQLDTQTSLVLAPGESTTVVFNCNIGTSTGAYLLYEVDTADRFAESDETNNVLALPFGG